MSVSYKAYAVLGVKLGFNELFKPKKIKAFEHNFPEDWRVDPKTGKDLWSTYPVCVLNNDEELYGKISNIQVVNDGNRDYKPEHFYYFGKLSVPEIMRKILILLLIGIRKKLEKIYKNY